MRWLSPELLLVANKATKKNLYLLGVTQQSGWILVNWTHFMAARGSTQAVFLSPCVSQDPSCDDGFVFLIMYSIIHLFPLSWACHRRSKIPVTSAHWCTKDAFLKHQKGAEQISKIMAAAITLANDSKTPDVSMGAFVTRLVPEPCEVKVVIEHYPNIRVFAAWCSHHTESRWFIHFYTFLIWKMNPGQWFAHVPTGFLKPGHRKLVPKSSLLAGSKRHSQCWLPCKSLSTEPEPTIH